MSRRLVRDVIVPLVGCVAIIVWLQARNDPVDRARELASELIEATQDYEPRQESDVAAGLRFQAVGIPSNAISAFTFDGERFLAAGVVVGESERRLELRTSADGRVWDVIPVDAGPADDLGHVDHLTGDGERIVMRVERFVPENADRLRWAIRHDLLVSDDAGRSWRWVGPPDGLQSQPGSPYLTTEVRPVEVGLRDGTMYSLWSTYSRADVRDLVGHDRRLVDLAACVYDTATCPDDVPGHEAKRQLLDEPGLTPAVAEFLERDCCTQSVWRSRDGQVWNRVDLGSEPSELRGLAISPDAVVAVGYDGDRDPVVLRSEDGVRWTVEPVPAELEWADEVRVEGDFFFMSGPRATAEDYPVLWSRDGGVSWQEIRAPAETYLSSYSIAAGGAGVVATVDRDVELDDGVYTSELAVLHRPDPDAAWEVDQALAMWGPTSATISFVAGSDRFLTISRADPIDPAADRLDTLELANRPDPTLADYDSWRNRRHMYVFVATPVS